VALEDAKAFGGWKLSQRGAIPRSAVTTISFFVAKLQSSSLTRPRPRLTIMSPERFLDFFRGGRVVRRAFLVCAALCLSACGGTTIEPSSGSGGGSVSGGTPVSIAGNWSGTFASSNNPTEQITMTLTQSAANVTGTWQSTSVMWDGQVSGTAGATSFTGKLTFSGTAADGTVCTGTADVTGSASTTTMSWTSTNGVVGGSCPAPLPSGIKIDVQRQ